MPESTNSTSSDRKSNDSTKITDLCAKIGVSNTIVINTFRIGKSTPGTNRPLVFTCKDLTARKEILSHAKNMKNLDINDPFKKISIKPDLTKAEQAIEKELLISYRTRKANGEQVFLRRGKITTANSVSDT